MHIKNLASFGLVLFALTGCEPQGADHNVGGNAIEPDNTKVNQQDRQADAKTPFDQAENGSDIATTAAIRREILKTDGLSTNADNIKIITANGMVTLRGVVASEGERETVRAIAQRIAGSPDKIDMQLEVDPDGEKAEMKEAHEEAQERAEEKAEKVEDANDPLQDPVRNR